MIRRPFTRDLGVSLEGPGGVGMYLYGENRYALYNMSDETGSMGLIFPRKVPAAGWRERFSDKELSVNEDTTFVRFGGPVISKISVSVKPFELVVVEAP